MNLSRCLHLHLRLRLHLHILKIPNKLNQVTPAELVVGITYAGGGDGGGNDVTDMADSAQVLTRLTQVLTRPTLKIRASDRTRV